MKTLAELQAIRDKARAQIGIREEDKDAVSKKDLFAMILSAMLVILPVAILILFVIAFGCYFLFFH